MMHEYYQVYDKSLKPCDLLIERPNHVPEGYYFGIVDCVCYNLRNDSFLMTKRSKDKPYMAGHLEVTVGCMQHGEDPLESIKRELMEETGVKPERISLFKTFLSHHAIAHTFVALLDIDPDSIVLQKGETDAYYWFKEEEFKRIWQGSLITQVQKTRISPNIEKIIEQIKVMKNER